MDAILEALSSELRRLKAAGVKTVAISPESLAALRQLAEAAPRRDSRAASAAGAVSAIAADPAGSPPPAPAVASMPPSAPPRTASSAAPASPRRGEPAELMAATAAPKLPPPQPFSIPAGAKAERMTALRERILADPVCRQQVRPGKKLVVGTGAWMRSCFSAAKRRAPKRKRRANRSSVRRVSCSRA